MKVAHKSIIDYRNEFVAHRDQKGNTVKLVRKGSKPSFGNGKHEAVLLSHGDCIEDKIMNYESVEYFLELVKYQINRMAKNIGLEKERLFSCEEDQKPRGKPENNK